MTPEAERETAQRLDGEYDPETVEPKWQDHWVEERTYAYDGNPDVDPDDVFSIDTPPPTVSGNLHMGHLYQHTLQDFVARFRRMNGDHCFFPFGYDDNGIASERLTEDELGIRHQDYSRREFQEKTREVCRLYEDAFTENIQELAISIDWDRTYKTIEPRVQRISQLSFIDLHDKGREYRRRAPAIWCPDCETAISQVEMEGDEQGSHYNDIAFDVVDVDADRADSALKADEPIDAEPTGEQFTISTTRPELLPACVAVFVHPEDEEHGHLVGKAARIPVFGQVVPIYEDDRVDLEEGTGVVMCCTFGDQTDIEWYQAHDLDLRIAIDESGTMTDLADDYRGLSTDEAQAAIVEDLEDAGYLLGREPISHTVNVHERCDTPIEFRVSEQWYVEILDHKDRYLEAGREMDWYPEKMQTRYEHWIEGLEWDWCISRQRDSGIPFPVWYCGDCGEVVTAERDRLPVDPIEDDPHVDVCPECGGTEFEPEEDVFDTWATSSLTPLINAGWDWNDEAGGFEFEHSELYQADLRPQGHDIISFWLFHTVVKCYEHTGEVPFDSVMINGMVLDENREAMSKSKGNIVAPEEVLAEFPVDAARYWAAGTSIGDDFPFKENDLVMGEKLLRKIWNASKLVDQLTPASVEEPDELAPVDRWLLATLDDVSERVTGMLDDYEFSKARDELRAFFWHTFCDDYLEIAKQRLRGGADPSTEFALATAHERILRLWAPLVPHVTEEVWQTMYAGPGDESIHLADYPGPAGYEADLAAGETALSVISALRKYKSDRQLPLNADLDRVRVHGDVEGFEDAIREVMHVRDLELLDEAPVVTTEIASIDLDYETLGPRYGGTVQEFDEAIAAGDFELTGDGLELAGETLDPDTFEVDRERTFDGEGDMLEAGDAVVIVEA
ncbi:valine--tRNA ligase [Halobacteriales archaeon QS_8_69_26]|nr:MAG: valine--tRNA ligase [Halobacteriales archaeon QS_8_69_26]